MTPSGVYRLANAAGLSGDAAIIATAIAWAESGLNPDAIGDENLEDEKWGPSCGLWQVRSLRAHAGTGLERDRMRLFDPAFNARSMVTISGGTNWQPWSVFKNGKYRQHLDAVRAAVKETPMRFVSRADWGADAPTGRTEAPGQTRGIGVHWLGPGSSRSDHGQCAGQMREIQAFHMGADRGWADFAYNAAACRHGYVFEGRGRRVRNAANGGGTRNGTDANAGWSSVVYLEGTDGPGLTPEGADAINNAAEYLGVADGEWLGHRDFLSTECPGARLYDWVHAGHPAPSPAPPPQPKEEDDDTMRLIGVTNNRGIFLVSASLQATGKAKGKATARYVGTPQEVEALVGAGVVPGYNKLPDLPEDIFDRTFVVVA